MLKLECTTEEATVCIEGVSSYRITMAELMTGCSAVMAQIASDTDIGYDVLMDMFLPCMDDERGSIPEWIC